ncbi:MAG: AtpZ/AtpI family protein [Desulfuromonas sp.]|nr:AtpZ/AtpI family protein [Desulfuromonas sp.]
MTDNRNGKQNGDEKQPPFQQAVNSKARRKQKAQQQPQSAMWSHFGLFGLVGWSVSVPTLIAIAGGVWLDRHTTSTHSWTLTLLPVGVLLGCFNAWRWISFEERLIHDDQGQGDTTGGDNAGENEREKGEETHDNDD